jgi:ADP-heptose:LPS heptosyltransferase
MGGAKVTSEAWDMNEVRLVRWMRRWRALQGRAQGMALGLAAGSWASAPLPSKPARILVLRLDEIGDALMGLPMLRLLRSHWPKASLEVLCKPSLAELYRALPEVDRVIPYTPLRSKNLGGLAAFFSARSFAARELAPVKPDLCINARWGFDLTGSAWLALFSGAPCRVAWSEHCSPLKARLNPGFDRAYTVLLPMTPAMHQVEQGLAMGRALGAKGSPKAGLRLPKEEQLWAKSKLQGSGWLALAPGASHPKKRWSAERFAALIQAIPSRSRHKLVFLGSAADSPAAQRIQGLAGIQGLNLCGQAGLLQSMALLERCAALIGNDSGPAHMAAAVGVPSLVVSSFASSSDPADDNAPFRFHPWGAPYALLQPESQLEPCGQGCEAYSPHCIQQVGAAEAALALSRLLSGRRGRRA